MGEIASTAPLRTQDPPTSTPLIRVCAVKGMKLARRSATSRPRMPYFSLASTTIERPSGVSSAREASCAASASSRSRHAAHRLERSGLAVAKRDRARLVEKERVDVTRCLDCPARHRKHVEPHQAVHAGNANCRKERADRRRNERYEKRNDHNNRNRAAGIGDEARDGRRGEDEDYGQAGQQDVERDLVRRFLPFGAFHQCDHPIEECRAGSRGYPHLDPVGQHLGAARHC